MTLNNYTENEVALIKKKFGVNGVGKIYYEHEVGEKCGTPHLQGFIVLNKRERMVAMKKWPGFERCHFEIMRGKIDHNIIYCSKDKTEYYTNNPEWEPEEPIETITTLKPWQEYIKNLLFVKPDPRTVYWFWDEKGNSGKSALVKYLEVNYKVISIDGGKKADICHYLCTHGVQYLKKRQSNERMVLLDIPRTNERGVSYATIEAIKNGMIFNTKFETSKLIFNPPHVVVFANFTPEYDKLSKDRWKLFEINNDDLTELEIP